MGYLSLLQEEYSGPLTDHQRTDVGLARDASVRLLGLIDTLLDLTTSTQPSSVRTERFDPREPIRDAVATTPGRRLETTLELVDPATPAPFMVSDRAKITKILGCLLSNAYKFTPSGVVTVSLEVSDGRAVYRVRDTGIGVPSEAQAIVFDDFRQADGSLTRRYGGAGLGLTLARRLARLLGGDIVLESVPGEGATFTVELPLEYQLVAADSGR
jgi:signal transduction histidine kinase